MYKDYINKHFLNSLHEGVYIVDCSRKITFWNKAAEEISGFKAAEVVGSRCSDDILSHVDASGRNLCTGSCPLAAVVLDGVERDVDVFLRHKDGFRIPVAIRVKQLLDAEGEVCGGIEMFTNLSNQTVNKRREQELRVMGYLDEAIGLPSKEYIEKEVYLRLLDYESSGMGFGILMIGVDSYRQILARYGSKLGGRALKMVASTLNNNTRPFDVFGSFGSGCFLGVLRNVDIDFLPIIGMKLKLLLDNSYLIIDNEHKFSVSVTIGGTVARQRDNTPELLERVLEVVEIGKERGGNVVLLS